MGIDDCSKIECETGTHWFKKRATTFEANNFIIEYDDKTGLLKDAKYFYCGAGIPLYMQKSGIAWTVKNEINPAATEADLNKVATECSYEAHKATIDTSRRTSFKSNMPALDYDMAVLDDDIHDIKLSGERLSLYNECMAVKGYVYKKSSDKKNLAEVDKYCPDIDTVTKACFIPSK